MANHLRGTVITQLRLMLATWKKDQRSDDVLLNQFIATRDEGAFTILVARHARVVWDTCYEALENVADTEDAFQRTFMLLAQRAPQIIRQKSVSAWLIGAARHECWTLRRSMARQKRLLENASATAKPMCQDSPPHIMQAEIAAVLREEVACLPESLRVPLVQRYLEEKTLKEIAFLLGCTDRGVAKRLVRGEAMLRKRLVTRGMSVGSAGLGALLGTSSLKAAVSPRVLENTIRAAMSAPPAGSAWLASISAVFGRLLASRLGLGIVVLVGLLLAGGVYGLMRSLAPAAQPPDQSHNDQVVVAQDEGNAPQRVVPDPGPPRRTTPVVGRVVDPSGKVIPNARIAVLATRPSLVGRPFYHDDCLAEGDGDQEGNYRLNVPTDFPNDRQGLALVKILVYAPGHGLATWCQSLQAQPTLPPLTLDVEQPVRGRLLDPQGRPAVGVRVAVVRVGNICCADASSPDAASLPPHWPTPAITDADGRYVIASLGRQERVHLVINDDRYGLDNVVIEPGQEAPAEVHLQAPRVLRGRLLGADNRKPLAGVRVTPFHDTTREPTHDLTLSSQVTDAEGRFRLPLGPGSAYHLEFATPEGMPYLSIIHPQCKASKPDQEAEFILPAGTRLAGRVTDASTNKPLANVTVRYMATRRNDPDWRPEMLHCVESPIATDADGRFSLVVSRAGGHLLLHAQEDDYRVVTTDLGLLLDGVRWGKTRHAHAVVPIDSAGAGPRPDMKIELHRGLSIKGRVVKPDGQPVSSGYLLCRRRAWSIAEELRPLVLTPQGTFSLDGCEPGCVERVLFVDSTGQWGAMADLQPSASATEIVTIRAERCGQGTVTLMDADGNPMPNVEFSLMVSLPEPNPLLSKPAPAEFKNARIVCVPPPLPRMFTDLQGKVQLPVLVPKATYRLMDGRETIMVSDSFQVGPGEKADLMIQIRKREE